MNSTWAHNLARLRGFLKDWRGDAVLGLPTVESQAVRTPILFSDVAGLRELKETGAYVVPPDNPDRVGRGHITASALTRGDEPGPAEAARRWARQFSRDNYAERTLAVYDAARPRRVSQ